MFLTIFVVTQNRKFKKIEIFFFENFMTSTVAEKSIALFEGQNRKNALVTAILHLFTDIRINNEAIIRFAGFLTSNCSSFW